MSKPSLGDECPDTFYRRYSHFVGTVCLLGAYLLGWPAVLAWLGFQSGLSTFLGQAPRTDSHSRPDRTTPTRRNCR